jgi:hypothetical protein
MKCPHCHGAITGPVANSVTLPDLGHLRGKRTDTEAQEQRIVAALRFGPKTTDDLRRLGIYQTSARVFGLRKRGYVIDTQLFDGYSADGYSHARMARYTLKEEPLLLDAGKTQEGPKSGAGAQEDGEGACK